MRRFLPLLLVPLAAGAALVDSGLSYLDAADDDLTRNVPRGSVAGGWHRAAPGATAVRSPTGYSTPMWLIADFSGGNDFGNRGAVSEWGTRRRFSNNMVLRIGGNRDIMR